MCHFQEKSYQTVYYAGQLNLFITNADFIGHMQHFITDQASAFFIMCNTYSYQMHRQAVTR